MAKKNRGRSMGPVLIAFLITAFLIIMSHLWIKSTMKDIIKPEKTDRQVAAVQAQQPIIQEPTQKKVAQQPSIQEPTQKKVLTSNAEFPGEVIEKIWAQRGGDYMESIFYLDGKVIARQKSDKSGVYEKEGQIPDGKVKFYDYYHNSYGVSRYKDNKKDNKKDNPSLTYYSNGKLKTETTYKNGKLETKKEYFNDGILSMEIDYTDAREFPGIKESGSGKSYFRNGKLKYEWNFTRRNREGFRKSYDRNGFLRKEIHYDEKGNPLTIDIPKGDI